MINLKLSNNSNKGFTLLEVIVSLIVISIFGGIFLSFFETQVVGSNRPVNMTQQGFALDEVMERITADYENLLNTDPNPLTRLNNNITGFSYGTYSAATQFITFDASDNEEAATCAPVDCTILKVSITLGEQTLTTLFTL